LSYRGSRTLLYSYKITSLLNKMFCFTHWNSKLPKRKKWWSTVYSQRRFVSNFIFQLFQMLSSFPVDTATLKWPEHEAHTTHLHPRRG